jgi:glutathione S-transferase
MPILYHFQHSPFSRRTRLALAHKRVPCELREVTTNPGWRREAQALASVKTIPVFVDGARALGDSGAITRWLDAAHPDAPRIWPEGDDDLFRAVEAASLVDVALDSIINAGTRFYALRENGAWPTVQGEAVGRAQQALDALAQRVSGERATSTIASSWSAADMWVYTAVVWLEGLPGRVATSPNAAQIVAMGGWHVPDALARWVNLHRDHPDVRSLA